MNCRYVKDMTLKCPESTCGKLICNSTKVDYIFKDLAYTWDQNHNGKLEYSELKKQFWSIDQSGDGIITPSELLQFTRLRMEKLCAIPEIKSMVKLGRNQIMFGS
jgi:hypothetical protein